MKHWGSSNLHNIKYFAYIQNDLQFNLSHSCVEDFKCAVKLLKLPAYLFTLKLEGLITIMGICMYLYIT